MSSDFFICLQADWDLHVGYMELCAYNLLSIHQCNYYAQVNKIIMKVCVTAILDILSTHNNPIFSSCLLRSCMATYGLHEQLKNSRSSVHVLQFRELSIQCILTSHTLCCANFWKTVHVRRCALDRILIYGARRGRFILRILVTCLRGWCLRLQKKWNWWWWKRWKWRVKS